MICRRTAMVLCTVLIAGVSPAIADTTVMEVPLTIAEDVGTTNLQADLADGAGFSSSSWSVDIAAGENYAAVWPVWDPNGDGGHGGMPSGTTVTDLNSITFYTKDADVSDAKDWYLQIFTYGSNSGWYQSRLTAEPGYLNNSQANVWKLWDTEDSTTPLTFWDQTPDGDGGWVGSTDEQMELNGDLETEFGTEEVKGIYVKAGDTADGWAYEGSISALEIGLDDSTTLQYNFVPEPATMGLLAIGGVALLRRRRRRA